MQALRQMRCKRRGAFCGVRDVAAKAAENAARLAALFHVLEHRARGRVRLEECRQLRGVFVGGSLITLVIALIGLVERAFDLELISARTGARGCGRKSCRRRRQPGRRRQVLPQPIRLAPASWGYLIFLHGRAWIVSLRAPPMPRWRLFSIEQVSSLMVIPVTMKLSVTVFPADSNWIGMISPVRTVSGRRMEIFLAAGSIMSSDALVSSANPLVCTSSAASCALADVAMATRYNAITWSDFFMACARSLGNG